MQTKRKRILQLVRGFVLLLAVGLMGFGVGRYYGQKESGYRVNSTTKSEQRKLQQVDLSEFWQVWRMLENDYVDENKIDYKKMVYGAIAGVAQSLGDPYTRFFPPEDNRVSQEDLNGSFYGVGIELGYKKGQLAVVAPLENSPAKRAGVKAGDLILHIKDESKGVDVDTREMSLLEAVKKIRGELGKPVTLTLYRDEGQNPKPFEVKIVREEIVIPSLELKWIKRGGKRIAHLTLFQFGGRTEKEWNKAVEEIVKKGAAGMILDLRNNPGGYLDGAIFISGEFLSPGKVVVKQQARYKTKTYRVNRRGRLLDLPLVVLINKGSASASEITAGALQANKRAKILGTTSFGKGTVQSVEDLPDGSSLHVTIAKWLLPNGQWIGEGGIKPDIEAKDDPQTEKVDEVLEKGIETVISNL